MRRLIITKHEPGRALRSSSKHMVVVPKIRAKGYGARSFLCAAVVLWSDLCDHDLTGSDSLAEFKARLNTHIFN